MEIELTKDEKELLEALEEHEKLSLAMIHRGIRDGIIQKPKGYPKGVKYLDYFIKIGLIETEEELML